jgi:DNA processing protein
MKEYISYLLSIPNFGRESVLKQIPYLYRYDFKEVMEYSKHLKSSGVGVLDISEKGYPILLKQIYDPPLQLFYKGDVSLLDMKCITIVGTRDMTEYGKWCVEYLLKGLVGKDVVVVSGLARGIDGHVHRTCLRLGIKTVGVVAGGIDRGYPKSNQDIYDEMDLVIAEFPPQRDVVKGMFPLRNRILAGLSSLIVVVESSDTGGSMITARLGLEYGRCIGCIPCNIGRFSLQGCNTLVSQGAFVIKSAQDILNLIE